MIRLFFTVALSFLFLAGNSQTEVRTDKEISKLKIGESWKVKNAPDDPIEFYKIYSSIKGKVDKHFVELEIDNASLEEIKRYAKKLDLKTNGSEKAIKNRVKKFLNSNKKNR